MSEHPTIAAIQAAVCDRYGVGIADLLSSRQGRRIGRPRHVAMWLCRRLTPHSMCMIGRRFGYRDHSSVYNAERVMERLVAAGQCPEAWSLLADLQRPHGTVWGHITLAHAWVTASTRRAAA